MKKETLFAIGLGVGLGLLFSVVLVSRSQLVSTKTGKTPTPVSRVVPKAVVNQVASSDLEIKQPQDMSITQNQQTTVEGVYEEGGYVVLQTPIAEAIAQVKSDRTFRFTVPLSLGENMIHISGFTKDGSGRPMEKDMRIYYLPTL